MDLIDRVALRKAMYHEAFETDSKDQRWDSGCWIRYKMFERNLEVAPTVPAVPLNKLCEWLDYHAGKPLDCVGEQCIKCKLGATDSGNGNCWKAMLTKWMEEQDAADKRG